MGRVGHVEVMYTGYEWHVLHLRSKRRIRRKGILEFIERGVIININEKYYYDVICDHP